MTITIWENDDTIETPKFVNYRASYYLYKKKIAFLKGAHSFLKTKEIEKGYKKALKDNNIPINKNLISVESTLLRGGGLKAIKSILETNKTKSPRGKWSYILLIAIIWIIVIILGLYFAGVFGTN